MSEWKKKVEVGRGKTGAGGLVLCICMNSKC